MEISQTIEQAQTIESTGHSNMKRTLILGYGVVSYLIGFSGLLAIIFAMAGWVPFGEIWVITHNPVLAVMINLSLTLMFGLQHSIMARPWFKQRLHQYLDAACERSTFIWSSGVVSIIMVALWQPVGDVVWQTQSLMGNALLWIMFAVGWSYLMAATFAINHWDLFGLRQVWFAFKNETYYEPEFKENWMYRFSRHPIMLGVLIGIWFAPVMTGSKLTLAIFFTAYIFIGVAFEEKDLISQFGNKYLDYKKRVGMFFTI